MSNEENIVRVRANTFQSNVANTLNSFVMKLKPEDAVTMAKELEANGNGTTLFLSIFENESKFEDGPATYLSTSIGIIETEEQPAKFKSNDSKKADARSNTSKAVGRSFGGRSNRR